MTMRTIIVFIIKKKLDCDSKSWMWVLLLFYVAANYLVI